MTRDPRAWLQDIVSSLEECQLFTEGMTQEIFATDAKTLKAVVRNLEIAGEAAKHVPEDVKLGAPHLPWKLMAAMRDRLIHAYFGVDAAIVWQTVQRNISDALPAFRELLDKFGSKP